MTTLTIAWFEFRTKLSRISTYVYFLVFTVLAALWIAAAAGAFAGANIIFSSDKVFVNSPYALAQTVTFLGLFGVVIIAAFMGRAVQQDFEFQTFHFFFTSPITKRQYLAGRFLGATVTLLVIFLGIALGAFLGSHWPGVDKTRLGPWSLAALVQPYLMMLLPNIIFLGAIFFSLAALARRMLPVYVAGVVVLIGYLIAGGLLRDIDNRQVAALIDPLGSTALGLVTRYWSPTEKNTQLIPFSAEILANRALWLAVGAAIFAFGYSRFKLAFLQSEAEEDQARRRHCRRPDARSTPDRYARHLGRRLPAPASGPRAPVPARDGQERLLRRDRASRSRLHLRQLPRDRDPLRHQHLPGDLPGARLRGGHASRSSCSSSPRSTRASWCGASAMRAWRRSPTACRSRRGLRSSPSSSR